MCNVELKPGEVVKTTRLDIETIMPEITIKLGRELSKKEQRWLSYVMKRDFGYLKGESEYCFIISDFDKENLLKLIKKALSKINRFLKDPETVFKETVEERKREIEEINKVTSDISNELRKNKIVCEVKKGTYKIDECDFEIEYPKLVVPIPQIQASSLDELNKILKIGEVTVINESGVVVFTISTKEDTDITKKIISDIEVINTYLRDKKEAINAYLKKEEKEIEEINKIATEIYNELWGEHV